MSQLLSVEGHNFVTYKYFFLDLEGEDSLFIGGDNKDTAGMTSNGVGKSLLYDAMTWCPFDMTVRGFGKDKVIGPYDEHTWVKEKWKDDEGRLVEIQRYRKHPKHSNNAVVIIDGVPASKVTTIKKLGTNAQIVRLLGIDGIAFLHSVVFSKGRSSICDAKEAKRRQLLSHILNLDRFDSAQKAARSDKRSLEKIQNALNVRRASIETEIVELRARIKDAKLALEEEADRLSKQKKSSKRDEANRRRELKRAKRQRVKLTRQLKNFKRKSVEARKLSSRIDSYHKEIRELRSKVRKLEGEDRVALGDCKFFKYSITESTCHACKQEITYQVVGFGEELARARSLRIQLARKRKVALLSIENLRLHIKEQSKNLDPSIDNKLFRTRAKLESVVRIIKNSRRKEEKIYDNTPKLQRRLDALKNRLRDSKRDLQRIEQKQDDVASKIKVAEFWIIGYGPKGIKKYIINGVLDFLQEKANEYLNDLTDGYIKIQWQSERALKTSGEKRDVLLLNVTTGSRGDKEYHLCSLGEKARVWLAVELALNALIRSTIDLALVDEAFDGLDPTGVRRAIKMLSDEGARRKIVCISHKEGIDKFFAKKKTVVLENDVSRLAS